jgi:tetratricopeptide (TPR) repeat protein
LNTASTPLDSNSITFSFSTVFWIDASSVGTITQGLKGICNLPAAWSSGLGGSPESALHWIGSLKENYVMVFDNADVLSPAELEAYLPPGRGGNILITSRNSTMMRLTSLENSLEVTEMEENDAIELLLKASCLDPSSMEFQGEASKIVKKLFCLPLAIDQAGAYIASRVTTIGEYLAKYSEHRKTLLSHSEFTGASKYNRSVYGTWELSYKEIQKRAESDDPCRASAANSAMLLLNLFPFFHYEGITEEIFSYAALQKDEEMSSPALPIISTILDRRLLPLNKTGAWDNFVFREGLRILLSFSLIKTGPSGFVYAMHPLVHTWGRDRIFLNERKQCCLMAYATLSCSLRWDEDQPYGFQRILVTHLRANMEYLKSEDNQNIVSYMDDAFAKFGRLLREQGHFKEAETLEDKVLDMRSEFLGVEHPHTITAMEGLAITHRHIGKYIEAEKLEIQVVEARKRILGVEHPDTIRAMEGLSVTYYRLGKYTESGKLDIQVLDGRKRILGVEHPETLKSFGNLAATYRELGNYTEAEVLEIQVLDAKNRILGVEHPDTIHAMANLTKTYRCLKKYTEAEKLDIQVVEARKRILGVEHPDTIRGIAHLAATYHGLGKYTEAEKLEIQVLDARTRILGVEHPETIGAMASLAETSHELGQYTEAEKLEIQVLDASNRVLGVEHPDTIKAMENLALTYRSLAKYTEAEELETQAYELKNRVHGAESPHTISTMANVQEVQEIQVLDAGSTVHGEENLHSTQVVLNHPVQVVLPDTTMNPKKKGMYFGNSC